MATRVEGNLAPSSGAGFSGLRVIRGGSDQIVRQRGLVESSRLEPCRISHCGSLEIGGSEIPLDSGEKRQGAALAWIAGALICVALILVLGVKTASIEGTPATDGPPIIKKLSAAGDFDGGSSAAPAQTVRMTRLPASRPRSVRSLTPSQRTFLLLTLTALKAKPNYVSRIQAGTKPSQREQLKHFD